MITKRYHQHWVFQSPEAVLTCSILKCSNKIYLTFGGHDKTLYLMNQDLMILDDIIFDGWVRCSFSIDIDGDNCDELLVGTGDGRFLVLKLDKEKEKLVGIMNYKSDGKVVCCVAGDFYRDGNIELLFGGEDKTLKVFKSLLSKEPLFTLYYDSWVTSCTLGYLKLPNSSIPLYGLLVGTKKGTLQLIQIKNNKPDIIWQQNVYSQINDIKIGDVTNDGNNEIIVAADDSYIKIYNSEGKRLRFIKITKEQTKSKKKGLKTLNRAKSLLLEDIDGDNAKEIIAGCADGSLRVFHNTKVDSNNYKLKWKANFSSSINAIGTFLDKESNLKHLIIGGYERSIRNITDFEWGKKESLKIPKHFRIPKISIKKTLEKIKTVPTNLRDHIIHLLEKKGFILTLDLLIEKLIKKGYKKDEIEEEIESMKTEKTMQFGKVDVHAWSLANEEIANVIKNEIDDIDLEKK
ncbi:MAG: hypothetical protein ACFFHV_13505 [Promethearchaeota archaeon]